jgi:hypothetical protein
VLDEKCFGMFSLTCGFDFEGKIHYVLTEQDTSSVGPGIGSRTRYICGLSWLYKLRLHGQQEVTVDGQGVRNWSNK